MQEKIIPQDISAEQSVLGAMMIDKTAAGLMAGTLRPEDFYRPSHQALFRAMVSLYRDNKPVDMITVVDELKKNGQLDSAEGVAYILQLANTVPTAANVKYHAQIVAEKAFYRQMVECGTAIASLGYEATGEVQSLFEKTERKLMWLSGRKQGWRVEPVNDMVAHTMDSIALLMENEDTVTGLSTGFADLDSLTFGLQRSDFIILAARPSMGKTALALNITAHVALRGTKEGDVPKRVAFFSLEMSSEQLLHRMICTEAEVGYQALRGRRKKEAAEAECQQLRGRNKKETAEAEEDVWDRLWTASDKIANASLFIIDNPALTLAELRTQARKLKAEGGLDLIVIDYLQLMQAPLDQPFSVNRTYQVSEISRGLKALARELDVPVLALSQLSRSVETRQAKRPMLSDLRESGSLEQDADIVMFLYREDYYKDTEEEPSRLTELIIAKHRNGPIGKVDLFFEDTCTKFIGLNDADGE